MNYLSWFYFSTKGRIGLRNYILLWLLPTLLFWCIALSSSSKIGSLVHGDPSYIFLIIAFIWLIMGRAVTIKRLHDCNLSGWRMLYFFVLRYPLALGMKGTQGPNLYDEKPDVISNGEWERAVYKFRMINKPMDKP